jgi:CBS domain-containing protein
MKHELVKDWMTAGVITVTPDTTLPDAHQLMDKHNIRRLPVLDSKDRLVGVVTRGDVRGAEPSGATTLSIWEINYLLAKLTVERIMTRNPLTVSPETTIEDAAKIMLENKVSGLPVVDESGKEVGVITESDIFRMVVKAWHED